MPNSTSRGTQPQMQPTQPSTNRPAGRRAVVTVACAGLAVWACAVWTQPTGAWPVAVAAQTGDAATAPERVVGLQQANCAQCHPSEFKTWSQTAHAQSLSKLVWQGNTEKYATAMGITRERLSKSVCAECHTTRTEEMGQPLVLSGVSCESCHGGAKGWLDSHWKYTANLKFQNLPQLRQARLAEAPAQRAARLQACDRGGQIRAEEILDLAHNCLSCHVVEHEKLVAAGHKAASAFELVSWSSGEVKHNFFMDETQNADAPSLWAANSGRGAAERKRVKFVTGTLLQLEMLLRARAGVTNAALLQQYAVPIFTVNGRLAQINAIGATAETQAAAAVMAPLAARLFALSPDDKTVYGKAADDLADAARTFLQKHDGSGLSALDATIGQTPPHFSQTFKNR